MDLNNLRVLRATLTSVEEDLKDEEGITGLTVMRDIRWAIEDIDALLPIVTNAEALAALRA